MIAAELLKARSAVLSDVRESKENPVVAPNRVKNSHRHKHQSQETVAFYAYPR